MNSLNTHADGRVDKTKSERAMNKQWMARFHVSICKIFVWNSPSKSSVEYRPFSLLSKPTFPPNNKKSVREMQFFILQWVKPSVIPVTPLSICLFSDTSEKQILRRMALSKAALHIPATLLPNCLFNNTSEMLSMDQRNIFPLRSSIFRVRGFNSRFILSTNCWATASMPSACGVTSFVFNIRGATACRKSCLACRMYSIVIITISREHATL